jgi:peptidoglycan/xylan/chitin deacetylase (PgdA/CDA1 family)
MKKAGTPILAGLLLILAIACAGRFRLEQMRMPPGGLTVGQVPQFVTIGNDDVGYSGLDGGGGLQYLTDLFAARKNPDGSPLHYSFYVNTIYITPAGKDDPNLVKQAWKAAIDQGHEIGVHTHSHPHGREFSVKQWENEMQLCIDHLTKELGVGRKDLIGFRTPFLEYNDHTLTAAQRKRFVYDCSVEEGMQEEADGRNFVWPFQLDQGSPGNAATYKHLDIPRVRKHKGLWELPAYAFIVPPDELCERYGVEPGLRARLKERTNYFDAEHGKITGFDWNLWYEFGMDKAEFVATLKYTLDLRLEGNRCPYLVGTHTDIYADKNPEKPPQTTPQERRDALREFVDYALTKPEVRFVSSKELLAWLKSPAPFATSNSVERAAVQSTNKHLGAGFRFSVYGPRADPGPDYWVRVGKEMASRFPGAKPEAIWILGKKTDRGVELPFAIPDPGDPLIIGREQEDRNEPALRLFDELGFRIWLQIEPRFASTEKLLHLVLKRYSHHRSVVGVGIDVEWYKSTDPDKGEPVSDALASEWLAIARSYNPKYRLFLKHWEIGKMPPTLRDGLLFVDDSQIFDSMEPMIKEFAEWGKAFAPAPVAFQIGYPSDRKWWSQLADPPKDLGSRILKAVPNTEGIFWVDFSVLEVFPPNPKTQ